MHRRARPLLTPARLVVALVAAIGVGASACSSDSSPASPSTTPSTTAQDELTTTTAAPPPETTAPEVAAIVLRGDGLGVVALGAAPDAAVQAVTAALGEPTSDTGWESSFSTYGTCPGTQIRGVEWDHLVLLFTDGDTAHGTGRHLFTWRVTGAPPALGTDKGLGWGATVGDAEELYPGAVEVTEPDEPFPGFLQVAVEGGTITGYLDGDVITHLEAGTGCGE